MPPKFLFPIDYRSLSKSAAKMYRAIERFIGVDYQAPHTIRRSNADAALKRAMTRIDTNHILGEGRSDLQEEMALRASRRISNRELSRQQNIESIVSKAMNQLPDSVSDREVDDDWVSRFFNYSQDVSNEKMQELWARLLAGEVAEPGSYSLRALSVVRVLDQGSAALFECMSNYVWSAWHIFYNDKEVGELLNSKDLHPVYFMHMKSLGLIMPETLNAIHLPSGDTYETRYSGKVHRLTNRTGRKKGLFAYTLTYAGQELLSLCDPEPDEEYRTALVKSWTDAGIEVEVAESEE